MTWRPALPEPPVNTMRMGPVGIFNWYEGGQLRVVVGLELMLGMECGGRKVRGV
jgi:hypothetical protein